MQANLYETRTFGPTNADLRAYARMEYKTEDPLWIISQARSAVRRKASAGTFGRRVVSRLRSFRRARSPRVEPNVGDVRA
jgi:hypothetical protein